eukprot:TRINITY_DN7046_c0_g1_i8.p1 TRINITY_DN7046_c0_g1~~TRINITY_DN7046_c0_g1_i8.p1  ORF type:complete len:165 (-),score=44.54 TRINITY_DN7046_c0_g1_i8:230-724(-)
MRMEIIEILTKKTLQMLIPATEKYFLWSAASNSSLFNFSGGKTIRKESEKNKPKEDFWDEVWNIVHLSKQKRDSLTVLKRSLARLNKRLQESVRSFLEAKKDLVRTAREVSKLVQEEALAVFQFKKTLKLIKWINEVSLFSKAIEEGRVGVECGGVLQAKEFCI